MLDSHPAASLFPLLSGPELQALVNDIHARGLREPIVLFEGKVLDGRNRLAACRLAGVKPEFIEWDGLGSPYRYVWSENAVRRHLDAPQKAGVFMRMEAADAGWQAEQERMREEANRRRAEAMRGNLNASKAKPDEPTAPKTVVDNVDSDRLSAEKAGGEAKTRKRRAEGSGTSEGTVAKMEWLRARDEALFDAVTDGTVKLADAAREVKGREQLADLERRAEHLALPPNIDLRCCDNAVLLADPAIGAPRLVHADPPWVYDSGGVPNGPEARLAGRVEDHYATLSIPEIVVHLRAAFDRAADDAYLLCWCTPPQLEEWFAGATRAAVGWRYKSHGCWIKTSGMGVGHHWRGDAEDLLLYVKGNPKPIDRALSNAHMGPRTAHSEKPAEWLGKLVAGFTAPGDLVLDLFVGLAPMARACAQVGRPYVGAEIDESRHREAMALLALGEGS